MARYPQHKSLRRLFSNGQPLAFEKGEIIVGNDSSPNGVYYIYSGYVKVYSISNSGDQYVHIIYGPGEVFPAVWAYLGGATEDTYYEALSECTVWRISREWFHVFLQTNTTFSYDAGLQLAEQFKIFGYRVDNLEYKKVSERIAYRLLLLASRFGIKKGDGYLIDAPITHELLANTINLARESVSRELERLERQGIIEKSSPRIFIKNVRALAGKLKQPIDLEEWHLL